MALSVTKIRLLNPHSLDPPFCDFGRKSESVEVAIGARRIFQRVCRDWQSAGASLVVLVPRRGLLDGRRPLHLLRTSLLADFSLRLGAHPPRGAHPASLRSVRSLRVRRGAQELLRS